MKTIHLMGEIGEKFGAEWKGDCKSVAECFQLIDCQTPGFRQYLVDCVTNGVNFGIKAGSDLIKYEGELTLPIKEEDIFITAIPAGAGDGSAWTKIFAAVVIIAIIAASGNFGAAGGLSGWASLGFAVAVNLAITGINELLMPKPKDENVKEGYYFSGPINTAKQGQAVPLLYGELIVGGAPISVTYTKREINTAGFVYNSASTIQGDFDAVSSLNPEDFGAG